MPIGDIWRDPIFINTVGHLAGVLLFSVILVLFIRTCRMHGIRSVALPLIAAALALGWNFGSLLVLAARDTNRLWTDWVVTASFSMLTMLPAVLLHVASQGRHRVIVAIGYAVSVSATLLHLAEMISPNEGLHQAALLLVAIGFGCLSAVAFATDWVKNAHPEMSQGISLGCLLLFTSSFLHFGYQHTSSPWAAEVTWHHLGVPLALIVLLRDYRFLLLDTFLRFVVNFGLAAIYVVCTLVLALELHISRPFTSNDFMIGIALAAGCASLILFAHVRTAVQTWMNRVIFRRQSVDACLKRIHVLAGSVQSEHDLLSLAARDIAEYLRTDHFAISGKEEDGDTATFRSEATIPLRFSSGDTRFLQLGRRRGGQRYWTDDLGDMRHLSAAIVEQVERFRAEELKRLVSQAELRALQAQINPHFLFNAFNTLYGIIDRQSHDARRMVLNLAEIFRYLLQSQRAYIALSEELRIVEAYLAIESLRLGDRLCSEIRVSNVSGAAMIPILSIQPLVENAVKHGVALKTGPCRVSVTAEEGPDGLRIMVQDTGAGFAASRERSEKGAGVGLENVRRRLVLSYGSVADLRIQTGQDGTTVTFVVPRTPSGGPIVAIGEHAPVPA